MQRLLVCSLFVSCCVAVRFGAFAQSNPETMKLPGGISVSRETTLITGPPRSPEGIDFVAAINQKMKQGVTPENNADVLLIQVIGKEAFASSPVSQGYLAELGISEIPDGNDFEMPAAEILEDIQRATARPWSESEFPKIAAWLAANENPLDIVHEASLRPTFYSPLVVEAGDSDRPRTIAAALPTLKLYGNLIDALVCRAMLRTQDGEIEAAWDDLMTCFRLSRLIRHHPTILGCVLASTIEKTTANATVMFAHVGNLDAEEATRFGDEFAKLPARVPMSEKYAFTSRLVSLESACFLARRGMNQMSKLTMEGPGSKSSFGAAAFQSVEKSINWDTVLRGINQRYDRKENAFAQPSYRQRKDAVDAIVSQLKREKQGVEQMLVDVSRRSRRPETPIEILLAQIIGFPLEAILPTQERVKARSDQVPVAFALSAYRHKHQEYPAALTDLTPDFIPELPNDVYTGDPLKYRKVGGGYELFAVGENLKEDSGLLTSTSDDIGVNTSDLKVVERVRLPSFGPILGYIGWGVGGIAFVVIGVVGVKLLTGKKKRPRRNSSRKGRSRNTARGLPPRRRQR